MILLRPWWLLALLPVAALALWHWRHRAAGEWAAVIDPALLAAVRRLGHLRPGGTDPSPFRRSGFRGGLNLAVPPRDRRAGGDPASRDPQLHATARRMDAIEIPALPIGYASFYTNQVQTGRFGAASRLAETGAVLAGFVAGAALLLTRQVPDTTRSLDAPAPALVASPALAAPPRRPRGRPPSGRRLLAEVRPDAIHAAALLDVAIYDLGTPFDSAAFRRALRRSG
jgi:hypothetical protein